jgi:hypothetical protein
MKKITTILAFSLLSVAALPQTPFNVSDILPGGLFGMASASRLTVIGTVASSQGIGRRLTEQQRRDLDDLSKTLGGSLYTIRVESIVCAQTDFERAMPRPQLTNGSLLIFQERDAPLYTGDYRRPDYLVKQRYLLFLTAIPDQDKLPVNYDLEAGQTYYEAVKGEKGVIPLPDDKLRLLTNLKLLCEAVRPVELPLKLKHLHDLRRSSDPDLRQSAEEAIKSLTRKYLVP